MDTSRDGGGDCLFLETGQGWSRDGINLRRFDDVESIFIADWIFFFFINYQIPYGSINFKFDKLTFLTTTRLLLSLQESMWSTMATSWLNFTRCWPNSKVRTIIGSFRNAVCNSRTRVSPSPFHSIESADKRKEIIRSPWISYLLQQLSKRLVEREGKGYCLDSIDLYRSFSIDFSRIRGGKMVKRNG